MHHSLWPAVSARLRDRVRDESGQTLVLFAVMAAAVMGLLALGVDMAVVLGGQRRFDQNGADAAAMAVGHTLASSVQPGVAGTVLIGEPDEDIYGLARQLAGLGQPTSTWTCAPGAKGDPCAKPTGINQNTGLTTRNRLAMTLEYWGTDEWGAAWCYAPSSPMPGRVGGVPRCSANAVTVGGTTHYLVPKPDPKLPFKVRVTVSSTMEGFFADVIGAGSGMPSAPGLNEHRAAACIRPQSGTKIGNVWQWTAIPTSEVDGRTTCAQAVVAISGNQVPTEMKPVIPITTNDCRVSGSYGMLVDLWDPSPRAGCPGQPASPMGSFKNMIDFSDEPRWCTAGGGSYSYSYTGLMPEEAAACGGADTNEWNREGYAHDPTNLGGGGPPVDVTYWIGKGGYGGTVRPDSCYWQLPSCTGTMSTVPGLTGVPANRDGNWFPTYVSASPGQTGNYGSNISDGLYCKPQYISVDGNFCTDAATSPSGTYFFARKELVGYNASTPLNQKILCPPPDDFGAAYDFGCRDAGVLTWVEPQSSSGGFWNYDHSNPERVRGARILTFRLYCKWTTINGNAYCSDPPAPFTTQSSTVFGRWISHAVTGPGTGGPLSPNENFVNFD